MQHTWMSNMAVLEPGWFFKQCRETTRGSVFNAHAHTVSFSAAYKSHRQHNVSFGGRGTSISTTILSTRILAVYTGRLIIPVKPSIQKQVYAIHLQFFSEYYKAVRQPAIIQQAIGLYGWYHPPQYDALWTANISKHLPGVERHGRPAPVFAKDTNRKNHETTHPCWEAFTNPGAPFGLRSFENKRSAAVAGFFKAYHRSWNRQGICYGWNWFRSPKPFYGHDIEAAYCWEAAAVIEDGELLHLIKQKAVAGDRSQQQKDWTLMVVYGTNMNLQKKTGKGKHMAAGGKRFVENATTKYRGMDLYLQQSVANWRLLQQYIQDKQNSEWF